MCCSLVCFQFSNFNRWLREVHNFFIMLQLHQSWHPVSTANWEYNFRIQFQYTRQLGITLNTTRTWSTSGYRETKSGLLVLFSVRIQGTKVLELWGHDMIKAFYIHFNLLKCLIFLKEQTLCFQWGITSEVFFMCAPIDSLVSAIFSPASRQSKSSCVMSNLKHQKFMLWELLLSHTAHWSNSSGRSKLTLWSCHFLPPSPVSHL